MSPPARVVLLTLAVCAGLLTAVAFALIRFGGAAGTAASFAAVAPPAPSSVAAPEPRTAGPSRSGPRTAVDPAWVADTARVVGVPAAALRAYADAELVLRAEQPGCHLHWNTLAGIGWIESQHGTVGGRTLGDDGRPSSPILGPALDGTRGNAAIRSTPESRSWHDDPDWEHAVGPLQFLTSTWARWGADGDGDGAADPRDLDDAALAAAR